MPPATTGATAIGASLFREAAASDPPQPLSVKMINALILYTCALRPTIENIYPEYNDGDDGADPRGGADDERGGVVR